MEAVLKESKTKEEWQVAPAKKESLSGDVLIDAYISGRNDGLKQAQKSFISDLKRNISKTFNDTIEVVRFLKLKKVKHNMVYMKINSWDKFDVLIAVPEKDFIKPSFLKVYDYLNDFESKLSKSNYSISFRFSSAGSEIDEEHLEADGYIFKHEIIGK